MAAATNPWLDFDRILAPDRVAPPPPGIELGRSRQDRPIVGHRLGNGRQAISVIGGCHADEPVGPAMLDRLVVHLACLKPDAPALRDWTWHLVPHANPDGEARNRSWTDPAFASPGGDLSVTLDLGAYLRQVVRELPGDDVEFGFPRSPDDAGARPENRAIADFLRPAAPLALHGSFHGMAFAAGPWFLIEHAWADRTGPLRDDLRAAVRSLGYTLHDVDRGGEKGFHRIDEGFTSRPDSRAMVQHFETLGDPATAALFRPSSMELARSLGGDPFTLVSEMPLFVAPADLYRGGELVRPAALGELRASALAGPSDTFDAQVAAVGVRPMPLRDQMRLQLEFLVAGMAAVVDD